jgi:uncharacterized lipoprotein YajG
MKYLIAAVALCLLAGCQQTLVMKNPTTGDTVACGPATLVGADISFGQMTQMERNCIDQRKQQGYVLQQPPAS